MPVKKSKSKSKEKQLDEFVIETVPIPVTSRGDEISLKIRESLYKLEVGQSFVIPKEKSNTANYFIHKEFHDIKGNTKAFKTWKVNLTQIRVGRIK